MNAQFFALKPDAALTSFISECKETAKALVGPQKYLNDPPHLTLYVGSFKYDNEMFTAINSEVAFSPMTIELNGWTTFFDDPVTGGHSLVIEVSEPSLLQLRKLQMRLVAVANRFRQPGILERYADQSRYSAVMKASVNQFGFPFVGDIWRAHFTIASFDKACYSIADAELKKRKVPQYAQIDALSFNAILPDGFETIMDWGGR